MTDVLELLKSLCVGWWAGPVGVVIGWIAGFYHVRYQQSHANRRQFRETLNRVRDTLMDYDLEPYEFPTIPELMKLIEASKPEVRDACSKVEDDIPLCQRERFHRARTDYQRLTEFWLRSIPQRKDLADHERPPDQEELASDCVFGLLNNLRDCASGQRPIGDLWFRLVLFCRWMQRNRVEHQIGRTRRDE